MTIVSKDRVAVRPRGFVGVRGPQAADYLQRMLSNDVESLDAGDSCEALLLTPKARVIAHLSVLRRGDDDFLLFTEPELAARVRDHLVGSRFAARAEIELEDHASLLRFGPERPGGLAVANTDYGEPAWEVLDAPAPAGAEEVGGEELELARIRAGTPRFGREIDDRVLPAEAGLVERAVSLTKGCYPGQEPIARLHYRGHANRSLRVLALDGEAVPEPESEIRLGEKSVGRVTSAARAPEGVLALGYVRVEVPEDAELRVGEARARPLH
jgi:folate-binding protein YgfZ